MAEQDIVQTPLSPLGGDIGGEYALQNAVAAAQQPRDVPLSFLQSSVQQMSGAGRLEKARAYLTQQDKQTTGFWPTFLATAAALKGQFGPAIQLQEQKRRTSFGKALLPYMDEISRLRAQGDFEGASKVADEFATSVGSRAPESVEIFKGIATRNAEDALKVKNAKFAADVIRNKLSGPDDPNARLSKVLDSALKNNPLAAPDIIKHILAQSDIKSQDIGGTLVQSTGGTTDVRVTPVPAFARQTEQQDVVGNLVAGAHKITPTELTNVLNRVQIGQGSEQDQRIREDYVAMLPYRARIEAAKLVPLEPIISTQMVAGGEDVLDVAVRRTGAGGARALSEHYQRLVEQAKAPIIAALELDPAKTKDAGYTAINVDPSHGEFLSPAGPMSIGQYNTLNSQGIPRVKFILNEDVPKLRTAQLAIEGLKYVNEMQRAYGNASDPLTRTERGLNRLVSDYLGVAFTPGMAMGKAAQAIVQRAVERMANTDLIDDATIGELKRLISGRFADDAQALQAANMVQQRLREEVSKIIGRYTVPDTEAIGPIQKQAPTPPPSQGPGGQIMPGPGAAPEAKPLRPLKFKPQKSLEGLEIR